MRRYLLSAACCTLLAGCVATHADQSVERPVDSASPQSGSTVQQAGGGNVATPIGITTAVPVGQVLIMAAQIALMGAIIWLSHKREVLRMTCEKTRRKSCDGV